MRVKRLRWFNESQITKRLIWQWAIEPKGKRQSRTQCELARALCVSQQYISKIERRWATEGIDFMLKLPEVVSLHDLQKVRDLRLSNSNGAQTWRRQK
jgi:DNA-binding XRE family transcriptional regulator